MATHNIDALAYGMLLLMKEGWLLRDFTGNLALHRVDGVRNGGLCPVIPVDAKVFATMLCGGYLEVEVGGSILTTYLPSEKGLAALAQVMEAAK